MTKTVEIRAVLGNVARPPHAPRGQSSPPQCKAAVEKEAGEEAAPSVEYMYVAQITDLDFLESLVLTSVEFGAAFRISTKENTPLRRVHVGSKQPDDVVALVIDSLIESVGVRVTP